MAVTTNYNWTTPDDVDLVKDGAAAIRTLGSSADTTVFALNPGTTAGDIDYYTTSTAKARIGIGTAGQVLQVNSGATAPEWATSSSGGMTLISTTTLTGSSVTLSSIPQTYNNLQLIIRNTKPSVDGVRINLRFNGDTGANYSDATPGSLSGETFSDTGVPFFIAQNDNSVDSGLTFATIYDYTNSTTWKMIDRVSLSVNSTTTTQYDIFRKVGLYNQLSAISSITFLTASGTFTSGTVLLYGVK